MLTRRFGRTELAMPVFSCGGMRYQFKWQDRPLSDVPPANQANLEATVNRALQLGINHIETARGYGSSERQLGQVLPRFERESLIVQTKLSPNDDPRQFESEFHESLARLQLDYVDLLAIHGINDRTTLDWSTRDGGCFEVAQRLREQGKVRFVGFSSHASLDVLLDAVGFGRPEVGQGFDYVNLHWYYIFQHNWPAIELAARRDMGVFIISPTDKGGRLHSPPTQLEALCAPLSPMVFNDLFCLSHPEVHTLSIGAARPGDFDEHLKTLPLLAGAHEQLSPLVARLEAAMQRATGRLRPEVFDLGLPSWEHVPENYNLETIWWLLNLAKGWGLLDFAKWRFGLLDNAGYWFAGNRPRSPKQVDDSQLFEALRGHPARDDVLTMLREAVLLFGNHDQRRLSQS